MINNSNIPIYNKSGETPSFVSIYGCKAFEDLMAEGYQAMADIHAKYAEITFAAISEATLAVTMRL